MLKMTAEIKKEDIDNLLRNYSGDMVRKSVRSALDKTGTWGKNYLADDVSSNYNLTASRVKQAITVKRTTQSNLEVSLNIKGARLDMVKDFGAIQDAVGIKANVSKTKTFSVPHAFINVPKGSRKFRPTRRRKGWTMAVSAGTRVAMLRTGRSRYPTTGKPGRGPSIPILVNRLQHRDKMQSDLKDHLYKELADQIAKRSLGQQPVPG